jgi:hypothetical protein
MIAWIAVNGSTRIVAEAYDPEKGNDLRAIPGWR